MPDKPSRNEEEYFARVEAERAARLRQSAEIEAQMAERRSHFMKCPRCGADLKIEHYSGIEVERCPECHGLWFDEGEAQRLVELNAASGVMGGTFRAIVEAVRGTGKSRKS
ncbi:MAG: zf-TFIIB domain-containing protein [Gemmatimonadota bacterium]|nr:zf-TFIIB domain-containing protein [Gemmatimonadota bacterium]MDH5197697.1 zf-TFIIB domain-containing protein [Gemmatimonadota bacterium]